MKTTEITGKTGLYGIIADPIHHVKTPQVVNAVLEARGVDGVLVPFHVPADKLDDAMAGLRQMPNLKGFVVTVPHKTAALEFCDALTPAAEMVGAVNCIRREADGRFIGAALDGIGFVTGLLDAGHRLEGRDVCLLGAGGAGKAIAFALAEAGVARLRILNRSVENADALAARVRSQFPKADILAGTPDQAAGDVIVNATPLGMKHDDPLPLPASCLRPEMLVAEIIMDPAETALMATARKLGASVHPGLPMLKSQAVLMAAHMGAF